MKYIITLFIILWFSMILLAQVGNISVIQDDRIEQLISHQADVPMVIRKSQGWRIQLKSSTDRNEVMQTKLQLLQMYPNVKTYLTYQQPYFKLRVGDYTDKSEAYDFMNLINPTFRGIFLVPDIVNALPPNLANDDKKN